jgi:hypothetical protein
MMLFLCVFKIEIEIRYGGWSGVKLGGNILDDCRAFENVSLYMKRYYKMPNQRTLFPEPAAKRL